MNAAMSDLADQLVGPFNPAESLRDPRKFRTIEWTDDTPAMLQTPELHDASWDNRGVAQMRRRSWPSLQERCPVCNDMVFPFARYMKNPVDIWVQSGPPEEANPFEGLQTYLGTAQERSVRARSDKPGSLQALFPLDAEYRTSAHRSRIIYSSRLGCHTCKIILEALINYDREESVSWRKWDREARIFESRSRKSELEDLSPDPTTICHLHFREGQPFLVTDGKHDFSMAWGKKLLGTKGPKKIYLHTGFGE